MKKVFLTIVVCFAVLLGVQAQQLAASQGIVHKKSKPSPASKQVKDAESGKIMSKFTAKLHFTGDQAEKVRPIVEEFVNEKFSNMQTYGGNKAQLKVAMRGSIETMNSKLSEVLSSDQQKQLMDLEEQNQAKKQNGGTAKN